MTAFIAFFRAVFRHWLALLSGPAISGVLGTVEHYSGTSIPFRVYGLLLTLGFASAFYLAWRDEYRVRLSLQGTILSDGPAAMLAFPVGKDDEGKVLEFVNHGKVTALNVEVDPVTIGDRTANLTGVAELQVSGRVPVTARIDGMGLLWQRDFVAFLEAGYDALVKQNWSAATEAAEEDKWDYWSDSMKLTKLELEFITRCQDLNGKRYFVRQLVTFEPIGRRLAARFVAAGQVLGPPTSAASPKLLRHPRPDPAA